MLVFKKRTYVIMLFVWLNMFRFSPCIVFSQEKVKVESTDDLIEASKKILDQLLRPVDLNTRDPFSIARAINLGSGNAGGYEFYPSEGANVLPKLKLRGYIDDKDNIPIALLDIDNHGVFLVRKGDTVGLQSNGRHTVIKVKDITKLSVLVEVGTVGQVVIVR